MNKGGGNDGGVEIAGGVRKGEVVVVDADVVDVDAVDSSNTCSESFARFGLPVRRETAARSCASNKARSAP